jgi:UDP-N-acetylglucosamine--N-acetylmuramyl-(pentapeptide) pyrophosphoryl-undecaprenol N-acetylglucosamine transferase
MSEAMARPLLVASAGGHLQELLCLLPALGVSEALWVSYDVPQVRSLLQGQELVPAHHPTTKHLPNAARNYRLAREVFDGHELSQVLSTGAAVAVPFMLRARQLGLPCHYFESATRVEGPSLSGRMLERLPGVSRYRQLGDWGGSRWRAGPSVFDGFGVVSAGVVSRPTSMLLSLGTHRYAFPALVERLHAMAPGEMTDLNWQLGSTPAPPGLHGRVATVVDADRLVRAIAAAEIVVGHAGVGLALSALSAGKVPVLVPRRRARREHTDDHQVQLAHELDRRGLAVTAEVGELTFEHLERAASLRAVYRQPPPFELVD